MIRYPYMGRSSMKEWGLVKWLACRAGWGLPGSVPEGGQQLAGHRDGGDVAATALPDPRPIDDQPAGRGGDLLRGPARRPPGQAAAPLWGRAPPGGGVGPPRPRGEPRPGHPPGPARGTG